jgi:hypothetical protein
LTLPTRALTGQQVISSEGKGASRAFNSDASAGSSPSQRGQASGLRTTGIRFDAISSIANLANPKNYKSNTGDWDQVLGALRKAVDNLEARVRSPEEAAPVFELREEEE